MFSGGIKWDITQNRVNLIMNSLFEPIYLLSLYAFKENQRNMLKGARIYESFY